MAVMYIGYGNDDGTNFGASTTQKIGFYGLATPIVQPATISTVDTTAITTVDTTTITAVQVMTATTTHLIAAANSLITDMRLHALAINRIIADGALSATAVNTVIGRLQALNLIASS